MDNIGVAKHPFLFGGKVLNSFFSHINNSPFPQIKLADKQAALEKIQWEAMTSNKRVEKLQEELDSVQGDISSFTLLLEGLTKTDTAELTDDYDTKPYDFNYIPSIVSLSISFTNMHSIFLHTLLYMVTISTQHYDLHHLPDS